MFVPRLVRLALVIGLVCSAFAVGAGAAQAAAPGNDDFANALDVNQDSSGRTVNTDLSEATVETSEPFTGVASTFARTTWFSYDAPDDGTGVVDLCASTVDAGHPRRPVSAARSSRRIPARGNPSRPSPASSGRWAGSGARASYSSTCALSYRSGKVPRATSTPGTAVPARPPRHRPSTTVGIAEPVRGE